MRKALFTIAFVVSGPISAMALSEPTPAPAADQEDKGVLELFEEEAAIAVDPAAEAIDINTASEVQVEAAPAEAPPAPAPAAEQQQVQPQQPVMYQQPQQQRYYYYQQQPKQGFFSRMMELERRKNRFLLRMIGIRRD